MCFILWVWKSAHFVGVSAHTTSKALVSNGSESFNFRRFYILLLLPAVFCGVCLLSPSVLAVNTALVACGYLQQCLRASNHHSDSFHSDFIDWNKEKAGQVWNGLEIIWMLLRLHKERFYPSAVHNSIIFFLADPLVLWYFISLCLKCVEVFIPSQATDTGLTFWSIKQVFLQNSPLQNTPPQHFRRYFLHMGTALLFIYICVAGHGSVLLPEYFHFWKNNHYCALQFQVWPAGVRVLSARRSCS